MKRYLYTTAFALIIIGGLAVTPAHAETTPTLEQLMEQIRQLTVQVESLKKTNVGAMKTPSKEMRMEIRGEFKEGVTNEDVKKVQEILAGDPELYPEGKVTGYFGRLTQEALRRFQERHDLEVTGTMTDETKDLMETLLSEKADRGLTAKELHTPEMKEKLRLKLEERCETTEGEDEKPACERIKMKMESENDGVKIKMEVRKGGEMRLEMKESKSGKNISGKTLKERLKMKADERKKKREVERRKKVADEDENDENEENEDENDENDENEDENDEDE